LTTFFSRRYILSLCWTFKRQTSVGKIWRRGALPWYNWHNG